MKLRFLALALVIFGFTNGLLAQTGSFRVNVFDGDIGEALIGATAVVSGTTNGAVTDLDGQATIKGLAPGTYNFDISFVGYQKKVVQGIVITANKVEVLDVKLLPEAIGLDEVVVTAKAARNSENALLTVQKKSVKVLDAITSEQFKINGDNSAASAMKRVTGVTVSSGKYVYVRGLGDRYSKTTLNGAQIPGLDPNKNSVQLDLFPSNLIDNIIVYKTFTPDLPGDFTGGLVDISTKDFPDRFTFQASASLGYNAQANLNKDFLTYQGSKTDWMGFDDGFRAIPSEIDGVTQDEWPVEYVDNQRLDSYSKSFSNIQMNPTQKRMPLNQNVSLSLGDQYEVFGKSMGFIAGFTYNHSYDFYQNGTLNRWDPIPGNSTTLDGDMTFKLNDSQSADEVTWGAIFNSAIKLNNNNKIGFKLMRNQSGVSETRYMEGLWDGKEPINLNNPDPDNFFENRVLSYIERSLTNFELSGEHNIAALNNLQVDWFSSYTASKMDQPDLRFLQNDYTVSESDTAFDITNKNRPGRYYRNMTESTWDNHLDFTLPFTLIKDYTSKLKFGGAYLAKSREFREDRYEYKLKTGFVWDGDVTTLLDDVNLGIQPNGSLGHVLLNFTELGNNYDGDQTISAGYLMTESHIARMVQITLGVRVEQTYMTIDALNGQDGVLDNVNWLPALSGTWEMKENTNLRASYTKTLARPSFREFAPVTTFGFYGDFTTNGNPQLVSTLIDNFDLRWEQYPSPGAYFGVSAFYKQFQNPIELALNPQSGGSKPQYTYVNVDEAQVVGIELEARKDLSFISPGLRNFRASVNATFVYSEVELTDDELEAITAWDPEAKKTRPMYNQAPYVINAALTYDSQENGWSSSVGFNMLGERLIVFSTALPWVYQQPKPELNFSVKKQFNDRFSMRFRANNLLNAVDQQTMKFKDVEYTYSAFTEGRNFSLGLTYLID